MSAAIPVVAVIAAGAAAFFYRRNKSSSTPLPCCPPDSIGFKHAFEAGATSDPTGKEFILPNSTMRCYVASPPPGVLNKGTILLFHDIFGLSSGRTRHIADEVASWGYLVVCPDFFDDFEEKLGDGNDMYPTWSNPLSLFTNGGIMATRARYPFKEVQRRLDEIIFPYISSQTNNTLVGTIGFCWGGWVITRLASWDKVTCGVGFHPSPDVQRLQKEGIATFEMYSQAKSPLLYLPAGNDPSWIKEQSKAVKEMQRVNAATQCVTFTSMIHGWVNRGDIRNATIKPEVDRALNLAKEFLQTHMKSLKQ